MFKMQAIKKSVHIAGFWFHIDFIGNEGIDQKGNKWINPDTPEPKDTKLIDTALDAYLRINRSIKTLTK